MDKIEKFRKNPYFSMSNKELELIQNDILDSLKNNQTPSTILPYAIEMHKFIGESCSLKLALEITKESFYMEVARRFFTTNKTKEHKIVNIGHVGTFDNRH